MTRIYIDMFVADQWLRDHLDARKAADTTLFFDPIFQRYGYSFEDYDKSVQYYLDHPDKYAKILSEASDRLQADSDRLQAEVDADRERESVLDSYRRLYHPKDFSTDSLRWAGVSALWPVRVESAEVPDSLSGPVRTGEDDPAPKREWEEIKPQAPSERPRPERIRIEDMDRQKFEPIDTTKQ